VRRKTKREEKRGKGKERSRTEATPLVGALEPGSRVAKSVTGEGGKKGKATKASIRLYLQWFRDIEGGGEKKDARKCHH